jgi:hypothetical protein
MVPYDENETGQSHGGKKVFPFPEITNALFKGKD